MDKKYVGSDYILEVTDKGLLIKPNGNGHTEGELFEWDAIQDLVKRTQSIEEVIKKGIYKVGDIGPSGGYVFFDQYEYSDGSWRYLEAFWADLEKPMTWDYAIKYCSTLHLRDLIVGWRLPTKEELNLMYENLHKKGLGNFKNEWYWSSSENSFNNCFGRYFDDGGLCGFNKDLCGNVRAVRQFW